MNGINCGICKVTCCNCKYGSFVIPVDIFKSNIIKVLYRLRTAAPAINGKGIAGSVGWVTAIPIQISICNIGRTADNDFVVISNATMVYIAAVNINYIICLTYNAAADVNSVIIGLAVI